MNKIKSQIVPIIIITIFIIIGIVVYIATKKSDTELEINPTYLKNYQINEVIPVYVSDETLAKKYLVDFTNIMLNYPEEAYDMLDDECKDTKFGSYALFQNYVDAMKVNGNITTSVKEYGYTRENGQKIMNVVDSLGRTIKFIETGIMEYTVIIE